MKTPNGQCTKRFFVVLGGRGGLSIYIYIYVYIYNINIGDYHYPAWDILFTSHFVDNQIISWLDAGEGVGPEAGCWSPGQIQRSIGWWEYGKMYRKPLYLMVKNHSFMWIRWKVWSKFTGGYTWGIFENPLQNWWFKSFQIGPFSIWI